MSTETKPPLKADAFGGGLCLVRERGFRVLGEGAGLQAGLALLLLGGHENAQIKRTWGSMEMLASRPKQFPRIRRAAR